MDYKKLSANELANIYIKASNFMKKRILKSGIDLNALMGQLSGHQLIELAEIHPYKELLCDTLLDNIKNHKNPTKSEKGSLEKNSYYENLGQVIDKIKFRKRATFFDRIVDTIKGRNIKLIEGTIDKKIEELTQDAYLISASQIMAEEYWKRDMVDSRGNSRDNIIEETPFTQLINRKVQDLYFGKAVDKYGYPNEKQAQEFLKEAYSDLVEPEKKEIAEVFGIVELTTHCTKINDYYRDENAQINSVKKVDNFQIDGENNLGEVFLVNRSYTDKLNQAPTTDVYRRNDKTGIMEKIGTVANIANAKPEDRVPYYSLNVDLGNGYPERIVAKTSNVSYEEKDSITANELHTKALMKEVTKSLGQNIDIREMTEVKLANQNKSGFLVKTQNEYGSPNYKMVMFNNDYSVGGGIATEKAKDEMFKTIELPTVYSNGEETKRDTAKVSATLNIDGGELQIYTDRHGNTRVAEIVDGKNKAYPVLTRTIFKDSRQKETQRAEKDEGRENLLTIMPKQKNSNNIAKVIEQDDERDM